MYVTECLNCDKMPYSCECPKDEKKMNEVFVEISRGTLEAVKYENALEEKTAEIERLQTAYHTEASEVCSVLASALNVEQGDLTPTALADMAKGEIERLKAELAKYKWHEIKTVDDLPGGDYSVYEITILYPNGSKTVELAMWKHNHFYDSSGAERRDEDSYSIIAWRYAVPFEGEI